MKFSDSIYDLYYDDTERENLNKSTEFVKIRNLGKNQNVDKDIVHTLSSNDFAKSSLITGSLKDDFTVLNNEAIKSTSNEEEFLPSNLRNWIHKRCYLLIGGIISLTLLIVMIWLLVQNYFKIKPPLIRKSKNMKIYSSENIPLLSTASENFVTMTGLGLLSWKISNKNNKPITVQPTKIKVFWSFFI